jgi:hypothetical protein
MRLKFSGQTGFLGCVHHTLDVVRLDIECSDVASVRSKIECRFPAMLVPSIPTSRGGSARSSAG